MSTITKYRFELDKSSKKVTCPECRQKRFVLYKDFDTGDYLPDHVGRCDRENQCGYHLTPKQFFRENNKDKPERIVVVERVEVLKTDYLPIEFLQQSTGKKFYFRNNFYLFLSSLFGELVASDLFLRYLIGTSAYWKGAGMFPQIDEAGNLRHVKIMLHDQHNGKRVKAGATVELWDRVHKRYIKQVTEEDCSKVYGKYLSEFTRALNLEQTFFGCHLLTEFPDKPVCIVESEKTAVIASVYLPRFIWLATGGASGCKWREYSVYKVMQGRSVTFFPDFGYFNLKSAKTCFDEWTERCQRIAEALPSTKIRVSDVLEKRLANQDRQDQDLADLLVIRDKQTGIALCEAGYPVFWNEDYKLTIHENLS